MWYKAGVPLRKKICARARRPNVVECCGHWRKTECLSVRVLGKQLQAHPFLNIVIYDKKQSY